jgi:hypothetical protein
MNGFGVLIIFNGPIYSGDFISGLMQGHGKLEFTNGDCLEARFKNNLPNG